MYLEHFGLNEPPFQLTPNPEYLYLSKAHARAKSYMEYCIWNRDGFVAITGEIGSGKTTLIQHLLAGMDDKVTVAKIYQTQLDELEFLQSILVEFGLKPYNAGKVELLEMLKDYLIEQYSRNRHVILIIDEAQNLNKRVLEEVRLLTGLETRDEKILNLILAGQPELKQTLDSPGMEQLVQRIRFRFHLKPLSQNETGDYIRHRLQVAGRGNRTLFRLTTIPTIYRYTGGVPRLINALCDTALICAYVDGFKTVSDDLVMAAVDELDWKPYQARAGVRALPEPGPVSRGSEAKLILVKDNSISEYLLNKEFTTIGRNESNHIQIRDSAVSGHHARIITVNGHSFLNDLNSTNGTYVNAERIRNCVLRHGDIITLAGVQLKFVYEQKIAAKRGDTDLRPVPTGNKTITVIK